MARKRIHELTNTATEANLSENDYAVVDSVANGTRKTLLSSLTAYIHNLWAAFINAITPLKTSFANGDKFPVVNGSTATAMEASKLLELTAQNALGSIKDLATTKYKGFMALDDADGTGKMDVDTIFNNFGGEFVPTVTEAVAGWLYVHDGVLYKALENYVGVWDSSKFEVHPLSKVYREILDDVTMYDLGDEVSKNNEFAGKLQYSQYDGKTLATESSSSKIRTYPVVAGQHYRITDCFGAGISSYAFATISSYPLTAIGSENSQTLLQVIDDGETHAVQTVVPKIDFVAESSGYVNVLSRTEDDSKLYELDAVNIKDRIVTDESKINTLEESLEDEVERSVEQDTYGDELVPKEELTKGNDFVGRLCYITSNNRTYADTSSSGHICTYQVTAGRHYRITNCYGAGISSYAFATISTEPLSQQGSSNYKTLLQVIDDGETHAVQTVVPEIDFVAESSGYLNVSSKTSDVSKVYGLGYEMVKEVVQDLANKFSDLNHWRGKKVVWFGTSVSFGQYATKSYAKICSEKLKFTIVPAVIPGQSIHCALDADSGLVYPVGSGSTCMSKAEYVAARAAGLTNIQIADDPITPWVPGGSYNTYYRCYDNVIKAENSDADLWVFEFAPNNTNWAIDDWNHFDWENWAYDDNKTFAEHRTTVLGALIFLMDKIYTLNPNARFLLILTSAYGYSNGLAAVQKLSEKLVADIDVWKKINKSGPSMTVIKSEGGTNLHPSTFAHEIMGNMLANELLLVN